VIHLVKPCKPAASYEYHGRDVHYEEAKSMRLMVEILSSNHCEAVYIYC